MLVALSMTWKVKILWITSKSLVLHVVYSEHLILGDSEVNEKMVEAERWKSKCFSCYIMNEATGVFDI